MDEGSSFKKETARFEINSNQSMWGLYFWQAENGRFLKDRQATQSREVKAGSHRRVGDITCFIY